MSGKRQMLLVQRSWVDRPERALAPNFLAAALNDLALNVDAVLCS